MEIVCPHCNETIECEVQIAKEKNITILYLTRKEYSLDLVKPKEDREYEILGYEADKDRFKAVRRKK